MASVVALNGTVMRQYVEDVHAPEFPAAREADAVVMTKDAAFARLLDLTGPPPSILWLTSGNTASARLRVVLAQTLVAAFARLDRGESLVEITGP